MKQIYVGTFQLGGENVQLFAEPESNNASFIGAPQSKGQAQITIGLNARYWDECVALLLHEVLELCYTRLFVRYGKSGYSGNDLGEFLFVFDHPQFAEACSRTGFYVTHCLPKLKKLYDKYARKRKKR